MPDHQHMAAGLDRFVQAAREQPIVGTCVTAEAVAAGLEHQRRRQQSRRTILLSAAMATAATLLAVALLGPLLAARTPEPAVSPGTGSTTAAISTTERQLPVEPKPALAPAVRLRSTSDVEVRGPWTIALRDGSHEIEVEPGAGTLQIELPDRALEILEGRVSVELVDGEAAVRLHTGVAAWVDEAGTRTQLRVDRIDLTPDSADSPVGATKPTDFGPTATELARAAEQSLAAGRRDEAIATYRQLVRAHPKASQTRAGLLDLARLLRLDGRKDEARCAYRLHLERWPDSSVRAEIESQLARLGDGPRCRGLSPQ